MSQDRGSNRKATPRAKAKKEKVEQPGSLPGASPRTLASIPKMPTVLSPQDIAQRRTAGPSKPSKLSLHSESLPARPREKSAARPLAQLPGTLKLPSIPQAARPRAHSHAPQSSNPALARTREDRLDPPYGRPESTSWADWDEEEGSQTEEHDWDHYAANSGGAELVPVPGMSLPAGYPIVSVAPDSIPDLAAFHQVLPGSGPRRRVDTRMLIERARSPWSVARVILSVLVMLVALFATIGGMGEPSQNLMQTAFASSAGSVSAPSVVGRVQPETQLLRPDLYDNRAQFEAWGDADCSAATASEVLTAWGVQRANIGKLIDTMQPDISLDGGLLTINGYQRGVAPFGYRADVSDHLTYNQLVYITHTLGLPVIVNVRISYGYFHFFSGGHFLVMTNGDSQGLTIVDSSEYYIKYLPRDVFYSMFTGITVVIVPKAYSYTVPNI